MIKNIIIVLLISLSFIQCSIIPKSTKASQVNKENGDYETGVLIIFYDQSTGNEVLLKEVEKYGAEVLYNYNNLNGISIYLPQENMGVFEKESYICNVCLSWENHRNKYVD